MTRLKNYILPPEGMNEAAYDGNLGFEEMTKFYQSANDSQIKDMEKIISAGDWKKFKDLIRRVIGVTLK